MTDVIIVGAGPAGLMLAAELCLAGVRPLVLERQPEFQRTPRAYGLGGQILDLLRCRGIFDRFEAASGQPGRPPVFPFGGVHLDLTGLDDPPLKALSLPQQRLERVLGERAAELGAEIRRGHEVTGISAEANAAADVKGPDGPYQVSARYLAGCDGAHSGVRGWAGIGFPGTTYPEVNRLAEVTVSGPVPLRPGFTRTDRGVIASGSLRSGGLLIQTIEQQEPNGPGDELPMTRAEFEASVRRVLGADLPITEATRLSRWQFSARQADRYRDGRIFLAGDAAHLLPATGAALNLGLLDTVNLAWKLAADIHGWAPPGLLDTYQAERHLAGARALLQTQAQVALRRGDDPAAQALRDVVTELLADEQPQRRLAALIAGTDIRYPLPGDPPTGTFVPEPNPDARPLLRSGPDLCTVARPWQHRVDIRVMATAGAQLIRPDGYVAWAGTAAPDLRAALETWFGTPTEAQ